MDNTQEEKFEVSYRRHTGSLGVTNEIKRLMRKSFEDGLSANGVVEEPRIPEGYYRLGDAVQVSDSSEWYPAEICALHCKVNGSTVIGSEPEYVRRIPAWKPKDGEAVLYAYFDDDGDQVGCPGVYHGGKIYHGTRVISAVVGMKPFDASKIGKPWSEI